MLDCVDKRYQERRVRARGGIANFCNQALGSFYLAKCRWHGEPLGRLTRLRFHAWQHEASLPWAWLKGNAKSLSGIVWDAVFLQAILWPQTMRLRSPLRLRSARPGLGCGGNLNDYEQAHQAT